MAQLVVAGVLFDTDGCTDIKVEVDTGLCVLDSVTLGQCIMSDISAENPINIDSHNIGVDIEAAKKICTAYGCDGYIMAGGYLITLKDSVATYREYVGGKVINQISYDTAMDYEDEE